MWRQSDCKDAEQFTNIIAQSALAFWCVAELDKLPITTWLDDDDDLTGMAEDFTEDDEKRYVRKSVFKRLLKGIYDDLEKN